MRSTLAAALLFMPGLAGADCLVHPERGISFCTAAEECPVRTTWDPRSQACSPDAHVPPAAPRACIVEVIYPQGAPSQPQVKVSEWCDSDEAAKALLVVATKLLVPLP